MQTGQIGHISVQQLHHKVQAGEKVDILDVRTPEEHARGHVPGVRLLPVDDLTPEKVGARPADQPLYIICQSGHRSTLACRLLAKAGIHAVNVDGGTMAWAQAGFPMEQKGAALRITR